MVYKYDISLPVGTMYAMVEKMKARLADEPAVGGVVGYGHLGDGNLHLNIHSKKFEQNVLNKIEPWLFEQTGMKTRDVTLHCLRLVSCLPRPDLLILVCVVCFAVFPC